MAAAQMHDEGRFDQLAMEPKSGPLWWLPKAQPGGHNPHNDPDIKSIPLPWTNPTPSIVPPGGGKQGSLAGMTQVAGPVPESDTISPAEGAIERAAQRHGMDPATLKGIAGIESSMNPGSNRGAATQYKGLFQIGREEWAQYGRGGDIYNADDNADAAARMLKDHAGWFKDRYGQEPSPGQLYMMHQQGRGFYSAGTMTNIAGNPYPGMRGPQTPASFEAGWTARLGREIARYGGEQPQLGNPQESVEGSKFAFRPDLRQASPDLDWMAKGIRLPKVDTSNLGPSSTNVIKRPGMNQTIRERLLGLKTVIESIGDDSDGSSLKEALGGQALLDQINKALLRTHGMRRARIINMEDQ